MEIDTFGTHGLLVMGFLCLDFNMNREDITRLAQEAGFVGMDGDHGALRRFAALVASSEREACAKIIESDPSYDWHKFACEAANAIRARGQA